MKELTRKRINTVSYRRKDSHIMLTPNLSEEEINNIEDKKIENADEKF